MALFSWVVMALGAIVLAVGAFDLEWIAVLAGAGIIALGVGYHLLSDWMADRALRLDFEDRWRRRSR
jgi:hypothetical protein